MICHGYSAENSPTSDIAQVLTHKGITKMHKREFISTNYAKDVQAQYHTNPRDRIRTAGSDFPAPLGCPCKNFPQFSWEMLLNFQHGFWGDLSHKLVFTQFLCIIASSSLKSPWTMRMTFCIMAWVTFALSLLHICVGFILPLRALTQVCVANGYGR